MKKTILISLIVVLVVAGIGYYLKQRQEERQAAHRRDGRLQASLQREHHNRDAGTAQENRHQCQHRFA